MDCIPLIVTAGEAFDRTTQETWNTGPLTIPDELEIEHTVVGAEQWLKVSAGSEPDVVSVTHAGAANHALSYKVITTAGYVLILDSAPDGRHRISVVPYRRGSLAEYLVTEFVGDASSPPWVQISPGNGAMFLVLGTKPDGSCEIAGVYRGDGGARLFPVGAEPLVAPYTGSLGDVQATVHEGGPVGGPVERRIIVSCPGSPSDPLTTAPLPSPGQLEVDPVEIADFSQVIGRDPDERSFTLRNAGDDCLIVSAIEDAAPFSVHAVQWPGGDELPASLGPDEAMTVTVAFAPDADDPEQAELAVTCDPPGDADVLVCEGRGRYALGFEPEQLDFGGTQLGVTSPLSLRIVNRDAVEITGLTIAGPPAGSAFSWAPWSGSLAAGASVDVAVAFKPEDEGSATAALTVDADAPGSPYTVALRGEGVQPEIHDLYIRDSLDDDGSEPFMGTTLCRSPDIILRNALYDDAQAMLGSPAALDRDDLSQTVELGQDNYLYLRIQNKGTTPSGGTATVYWAPPSAFPTPASWNEIGTIAIAPVAPGAVAVVGPMAWNTADLPGVGHFCFIALVFPEGEDPPDPDQITAVQDFYRLVRESNNVAWKNFNVVDLLPGSRTVNTFAIHGWPRQKVFSDLVIDLSRVPASAQVNLRINRRIAAPARIEHMQLVAEGEHHHVYAARAGRVCALRSLPLEPSHATQAELEVIVQDDVTPFPMHIAQVIAGRETGRVTWSFSTGQHQFVGNVHTHELHVPSCGWLDAMLARHMVPFRTIPTALARGYDGCSYCLPEHHHR